MKNHIKTFAILLLATATMLSACGGSDAPVPISPTTTDYTIGGTVSGLTGGVLVLQNNAGDDLSFSANDISTFTFATSIANGAGYAVTVKTQPTTPLQTCIVTNGSGTVNGSNVTNVLIECFSPGSLDPSFDSDGIVTTSVGSHDDYARSVAIQPDGKIVAAGYSYNGSKYDFALVRYNANGSLDTSFDSDGIVTTSVGSYDDYARSVAIQPDGKIVAAGSSRNGPDRDFALVRYNTDGSLDPSFDSDGIVTTAIGTSNDSAYSVAIQPDGKIVAAGYSWTGSVYAFTLVRYNTDGSLDPSFDSDGKVTTPIGTEGSAYSVAIQPDGKIVAAGYSDNGSVYAFALVRYNTDGSLDTSFDSDGKVTTPIGTEGSAYSVAIQPDGKIVAAGYSDNGSVYAFTLVRYNANGSPDTSFGTNGNGIVTTAIGTSNDYAYSVAIQSDGRIVAAGSSRTGSADDFTLVRYNANGSLDTTFGTGGIVISPILVYGNDYAYSVAIQSDGRIVAAGCSWTGEPGPVVNFALARYWQ